MERAHSSMRITQVSASFDTRESVYCLTVVLHDVVFIGRATLVYGNGTVSISVRKSAAYDDHIGVDELDSFLMS